MSLFCISILLLLSRIVNSAKPVEPDRFVYFPIPSHPNLYSLHITKAIRFSIMLSTSFSSSIFCCSIAPCLIFFPFARYLIKIAMDFERQRATPSRQSIQTTLKLKQRKPVCTLVLRKKTKRG